MEKERLTPSVANLESLALVEEPNNSGRSWEVVCCKLDKT